MARSRAAPLMAVALGMTVVIATRGIDISVGAVVAIVAFATGSGVVKSLAGGVAGFVLATAYTWWRLRARERAAERSP